MVGGRHPPPCRVEWAGENTLQGVALLLPASQEGRDGSSQATDGRQLLVQTRFSLPREDDVLVPGIQLIIACAVLYGVWLTLEEGSTGPWV